VALVQIPQLPAHQLPMQVVVAVGLHTPQVVLVQVDSVVVVKVEPTSMKTDTQEQRILEVVVVEQAVVVLGHHIQILQEEQGVQVL
jgi:formyltetrahydrofolate hydrolase